MGFYFSFIQYLGLDSYIDDDDDDDDDDDYKVL